VKAFGQLISANTKLFVRNRQTLVWSLVFPLMLMVLLGLFFGHETQSSSHVDVVGGGAWAAAMLEGLKHVPGIVVHAATRPQAISQVRSGTAALAIIVQAGSPVHLTIWQSVANTATNGVSDLVVQQVANGVQQAMQHTPSLFTVATRSVSGNSSGSYIDFLVPGVLAMELMSNGLFSGLAMVTYREQGILRRIRVTPVPTVLFLASRIVVQLLVLVVQLLLTLAVAMVLFQYQPVGGTGPAAATILVGALTFIAAGFFVAGVARTADAASAIANLINLPMMFLGGVFFPTSGFGGAFGFLIRIVPLGYLSSALRLTLSNGDGFPSIGGDLLFLVGTLVVATALAARFFRWDSRPA
jgi:ABC-2 type transport system permease protein